jgi:peptidoglycan/LPS O-acetylase OafA/YrhL
MAEAGVSRALPVAVEAALPCAVTTCAPGAAPALGPADAGRRGSHDGARLSGLDGLRAIAVLAVILYHADLGWLPGGFLGVDVFFVISGFLITTLLLAERERLGHIRLRAFWLRRARRLLPALFLVLAATLSLAVLFAPDEVARVRGDTLAALAYVTNWYLVLRQQSYFEAMGRPSPLLHLWSLAVEEQFYLLWPLALAVGMLVLRRRGMLLATLLGAAGSALLMAMLYTPGVDPSRVYYGTDTHAVGLLVGAALALAWSPRPRTEIPPPAPDPTPIAARPNRGPLDLPPWPDAPETFPRSAGRDPGDRLAEGAAALVGRVRRLPWWDLIGVGGLALMLACFAWFDEYEPLLYRGGFAALALVTAAVIVAAVRPGDRIGTGLLDRQPLRWIGERSYGIYLWHWPIFTLTRPQLDVALDPIPDLALRLLLTLAAAEASYRFLETPVRHGALGRAWRAWRAVPRGHRVSAFRWPMATGGAAMAMALVMAARVAGAVPPPPPPYLAVTSIDVGGPATAASAAPVAAPSPALVDPSPLGTAGPAGPATPGATAPGAPPDLAPGSPPARPATPPAGPSAAAPVPRAPHVLAIGDSVMLGAVTQLRLAVHGIEVNAAVGRAFGVGVEILQQRQAQGVLPGAVVIGLGDNGWVTAAQIDQAMHVLRGASVVVFVNLKEPRSWEAHDNALIADAAHRYSNVVVVDWHDASANHPEYFWDDGIHLRPAGATAYARLVAAALTAGPGASPSPSAPSSAAPSTAAGSPALAGASPSGGASPTGGASPPGGASPTVGASSPPGAPVPSAPAGTAPAGTSAGLAPSPSLGP